VPCGTRYKRVDGFQTVSWTLNSIDHSTKSWFGHFIVTGWCSLNRQLNNQRRRWESNPLQTALQAVAVPSGSSVKVARQSEQPISFSKSSDCDSRPRNEPFFKQHFLKRLPLPHGQRSLRPSFSSSSLSLCTMRTPRFTFLSEGNPCRRLLIRSKKMVGHQNRTCARDTSFEKSSGEKKAAVSSPGIEPGPRPSRGRMQIQHTPRTSVKVV
jgi:hypothetical protein